MAREAQFGNQEARNPCRPEFAGPQFKAQSSRFVDRVMEVWLILADPSERQGNTLSAGRRKSHEDHEAIMSNHTRALSSKVALGTRASLTIGGDFPA
jgi:hypothetical protein